MPEPSAIPSHGGPTQDQLAIQFDTAVPSSEASDQPSRLILALDQFSGWNDEMRDFIGMMSPEVAFFKIGMRAFFGGGFALLEELKKTETKVFLDLKLLDIPNTVAAALKSLEAYDIVLATVHMMGKGLEAALRRAELADLKVLVVTVLTSEAAGGNVAKKVVGLSTEAHSMGCAGVICSPLEAPTVRARTDKDFLIVCPGVRPVWSTVEADDQQRVTTPAQAIENGANYVVVGRPIYQAAKPLEAARRINQEIAAAELSAKSLRQRSVQKTNNVLSNGTVSAQQKPVAQASA